MTVLGSASSAAASVTSTPMASACPPRSLIAAAVAAACSPRAVATTVAPCRASWRAIARPIPRDAPVTSATFPDRLNMMGLPDELFDRSEIVRAAEVRHVRVFVYLAHQSAQHRARTNLNIRCDALGRKAAHDVFPP